MFEQDRTFGEALSDKTKARFMGIKEKFTPLNIIRMLTGSGGIGRSIRTVAGRAMGYSEGDIQYFGGYKRKRSIYGADRSRVPAGSKSVVKVNDSTADILAKMYNLMRKIDEDNTRRYEKEQNFEEENILEDKKRHEKVLDALGAKNKKVPEKVEKPKEETDEKDGILVKIFSSVFGVFKKVFSFFKVIGEGLLTILTIGGLVKTLSLIGDMFKMPIKLFSNILISILPTLARLLFGIFRAPFIALATGIFASLIAIQDRDFTKDFDFSKYKKQLPGQQTVQYDKDTGKPIGFPVGKGMPTSMLNEFGNKTENDTPYDDEAFYKLKTGQKNIYPVPIIGTAKEIQLALSDEEALQLFKSYQIFEEAHKRYLAAEATGNKESIINAKSVLAQTESEVNDILARHTRNTYKKYQSGDIGDIYKLFTEKSYSKQQLAIDNILRASIGNSMGEIQKEFGDTIKDVTKSMGIDTDTSTSGKTIGDINNEFKKLIPIVKELVKQNDYMESLNDIISESLVKQNNSVVNLNQKNTTQQQSNLRTIEIRDSKLLESSSSK